MFVSIAFIIVVNFRANIRNFVDFPIINRSSRRFEEKNREKCVFFRRGIAGLKIMRTFAPQSREIAAKNRLRK